MKEEARLTLERVIHELDKTAVFPEPGSWKAAAEQIKPDDEEGLRRFLVYRGIVSAGAEGLQRAVQKILIGENILTPSLVTKGWTFWRQPLLTESEKKAVESAVVRWADAEAAQAWSIKDKFDKLPNKDAYAGAVSLASLLDVRLSCMQQLSTDLKGILLSAKKE